MEELKIKKCVNFSMIYTRFFTGGNCGLRKIFGFGLHVADQFFTLIDPFG
jgi:hypothetical protein